MTDTAGARELSAEDKKLVTLARATRARIGAAQGAAARDGDGRTYAAATVDLPSLRLSAVHAVVAMAVASGSTTLEACVLLGDPTALDDADAAALRDVAAEAGVVVHVGDARGGVASTTTV